jgi:holo-[acyl-carrier protein] synthase
VRAFDFKFARESAKPGPTSGISRLGLSLFRSIVIITTKANEQMHRVAFPYSLSIGTDIVHLLRIRRLVSKREGRTLVPFARRILHPLEFLDLSHRHPKWEAQREQTRVESDSVIQWLGGRFAAKEAARKAIGATMLGWKDVRVEVKGDSGQPCVVYNAQGSKEEHIEHEAKLSISHDGDYVIATVLAAAPVDRSGNSHSEASAES